MELPKIPITSLIPQRYPFIMVDRIIDCNDKTATTEFLVKTDNILLEDDKLSVAGVIENMAQSCAARMGVVNKIKGDPIYIGFIGDIKGFHINRLPKCNELLTTQIDIMEQVFNLTLASVCTRIGEETIAEAMIKISQTDVVANL